MWDDGTWKRENVGEGVKVQKVQTFKGSKGFNPSESQNINQKGAPGSSNRKLSTGAGCTTCVVYWPILQITISSKFPFSVNFHQTLAFCFRIYVLCTTKRFNMNKQEQQLEALQDIRQLMKQSSRFLSLSGLSGVFAGVYALVGAWMGNQIISAYVADYWKAPRSESPYTTMLMKCILVCASVLAASLLTAHLFSSRKARKNNETLFNHIALKLVINLMIPLLAGGVFCLAMLFHGEGYVIFVCPGMLIFYGLALINASKYTLHDVRYLGLLQLLLGLICLFFPGYGLLYWAIGFGLLHIVYGSIMWFKYDRK